MLKMSKWKTVSLYSFKTITKGKRSFSSKAIFTRIAPLVVTGPSGVGELLSFLFLTEISC